MASNPTLETYNQYANVYDEGVAEFWQNFPKDFLEQFQKHTPGKRILDVGSGSGRDALLLRNMGFEVVCQDGSTSMIDITNKLGFESHLANFSDIGFPAASFDGIWAYTSLIHIPKDEAKEVIQNLRPLLGPNGTFAIGVIEGTNAGIITGKGMPGAGRYFKNYTSQELKELIEPLGFAFISESKYQPHHSVYLAQLYKTS